MTIIQPHKYGPTPILSHWGILALLLLCICTNTNYYINIQTHSACFNSVGILTNPSGNRGRALLDSKAAASLPVPARAANLMSRARAREHHGKRRLGRRLSVVGPSVFVVWSFFLEIWVCVINLY